MMGHSVERRDQQNSFLGESRENALPRSRELAITRMRERKIVVEGLCKRLKIVKLVPILLNKYADLEISLKRIRNRFILQFPL